jgi:hypothetical protein
MSTAVKTLAKSRNFRTLVLELGFDSRTGETHDWLVFNEKCLGEYQAPKSIQKSCRAIENLELKLGVLILDMMYELAGGWEGSTSINEDGWKKRLS